MLRKNLLLLLMILPLLTNTPVLAQEELQTSLPTQVEMKKLDPRARVLQSYFAKYDSPLQYQAQHFVEAADIYGLDWKLVPAIAGVESTFGKFMPGGRGEYTSYNAWGWGVYGTQAIYFKSWREGIFTVTAGLRKNYINRGLYNTQAINRMYSTSPAWAGNVNYFLNDLEKFETQYDQSNEEKALPSGISAAEAGASGQLALK